MELPVLRHKKTFVSRRWPLINLWGANWNMENVLKLTVGTTRTANIIPKHS